MHRCSVAVRCCSCCSSPRRCTPWLFQKTHRKELCAHAVNNDGAVVSDRHAKNQNMPCSASCLSCNVACVPYGRQWPSCNRVGGAHGRHRLSNPVSRAPTQRREGRECVPHDFGATRMCSMDSRVYIERPNAWVRVCSNVSLETVVHTGLIGPRRPQDWFLKRLQGWANPSSRGLWGGDAALHCCFWRCQRSTPAGQRSRWGEGREHHRARAGPVATTTS
jgi:hypothetical protein